MHEPQPRNFKCLCCVDVATFVQVEVTHRIAWRRGTAFCDASTVAAGNLIGQGGAYACRSGCSGSLGSTQFQCTDFSVSEDWSAGQGSSTVTLSGVTNFEAS